MIVLDASAVVDLLIRPSAVTRRLRARIEAASMVYAPHLMDAEVANALLDFSRELAAAVHAEEEHQRQGRDEEAPGAGHHREGDDDRHDGAAGYCQTSLVSAA